MNWVHCFFFNLVLDFHICYQLLKGERLYQHVWGDYPITSELLSHLFHLQVVVVAKTQIIEYVVETVILFLHFLVMTPTLICGSRTNECCHTFEDLIHSPQVLILKVAVMHLQEPVVSLFLDIVPMSNELPWFQWLSCSLFFLRLLFFPLRFVEYMEVTLVII